MSRESRVHLGDQFDGGFDSLAIRFARIQFPLAQIRVHVPHTAAAPRGNTAQQRRARLAQANCGQPAMGHQFITVGDVGLQPLDHHR